MYKRLDSSSALIQAPAPDGVGYCSARCGVRYELAVFPKIVWCIGEDKHTSCAYVRVLHFWTHTLSKHHCP